MEKSNNKKVVFLSIALAVSLVAVIVMGVMLINNSGGKVTAPQWEMAPISEEQAAKDSDYDPQFMQLAIKNALENKNGGPIGAVIVKDGVAIASAANENRATGHGYAHAEMCAIRDASDFLNSKSLDGCVLYTSAQPCLMCESAIAGAGIETVYYAATLEDMDEFGYDDIDEYEAIQRGENLVKSYAIDIENKLEPLENKKGKNK